MTIRHEWKNFDGILRKVFMAGEAVPATPQETTDKPAEADNACDAGSCHVRIEKAEVNLGEKIKGVMQDFNGKQGGCAVTKGEGWTKYTQPFKGGEKIHVVQNSNGTLRLFVEEPNGFMRQVPLHTEGIKTAMSTTDAAEFLGNLVMVAEHTKSGIAHGLKQEAKTYKLRFEKTVDGKNEFYFFKNDQGETVMHVYYDAAKRSYQVVTHDERGENTFGRAFSADEYENLTTVIFAQRQQSLQKKLAGAEPKLAKR